MFIGDSLNSCLVAVVSVEPDSLKDWAVSEGIKVIIPFYLFRGQTIMVALILLSHVCEAAFCCHFLYMKSLIYTAIYTKYLLYSICNNLLRKQTYKKLQYSFIIGSSSNIRNRDMENVDFVVFLKENTRESLGL